MEEVAFLQLEKADDLAIAVDELIVVVISESPDGRDPGAQSSSGIRKNSDISGFDVACLFVGILANPSPHCHSLS
ncbi:MAG: hypothetical protein AAF585_11550 [Verrucomicrobiota bacterium]